MTQRNRLASNFINWRIPQTDKLNELASSTNGQTLSVSHSSEVKFPNIQSKSPLAQLEAISSCPITCYLGEETDPHLTTTSFQLHCPSLDMLQPLNVSLVVRGPKLNTVFECYKAQQLSEHLSSKYDQHLNSTGKVPQEHTQDMEVIALKVLKLMQLATPSQCLGAQEGPDITSTNIVVTLGHVQLQRQHPYGFLSSAPPRLTIRPGEARAPAQLPLCPHSSLSAEQLSTTAIPSSVHCHGPSFPMA
ncbi:hypothetical protein QYF61_022947 [Mycteria americana]|uniref:Uncharacterized protein n=1 Tax=Mycteria americana TaxID=33587 RepID=A0AAN7SB29_MYCAM|nr:hypothetical protein QYF61_022947 [Mycteria americana]